MSWLIVHEESSSFKRLLCKIFDIDAGLEIQYKKNDSSSINAFFTTSNKSSSDGYILLKSSK